VRRVGRLLRRRRTGPPLQLTASDLRRSAKPAASAVPGQHELQQLATEVGHVAAYVAQLKAEIAALRPAELCSDRLPGLCHELAAVDCDTKAATDRIMAAAETMLSADRTSTGYAASVEAGLLEILEACAFQDLAGQRLARAKRALAEIERRLQRFAASTGVADATAHFDREAIMREVRGEVLLVDGPQTRDQAIGQSAVDELFD
jgi:chemotaxis protein CheZ